jgi:transglutaminase-like putative cysteine protease
MIKYITIIIVVLFVDNNLIYSQYPKMMYSYKGNAGINMFDFSYDVTLNFNTPIIGKYQWIKTTATKGLYCTNIKNDDVINNKLSNVARTINNTNYITFTAEDIAVDDYYQNNIYLNVSPGYNQSTIKFSIDYNQMATSVDLSNAVYSSYVLLTFPLNVSTLPNAVLKYLNASPLVESTNSSIASTASTITSGCTDLRTAIIKLGQWIEGNITMSNTNPPNKSSIVFSTKVADCDGAAHLLAAFCRSLNIPARIVSGYYINNPFHYPLNKTGTSSIAWGTPGNDWHAACEIYVPYMNKWVRCDPAQRSVLF